MESFQIQPLYINCNQQLMQQETDLASKIRDSQPEMEDQLRVLSYKWDREWVLHK